MNSCNPRLVRAFTALYLTWLGYGGFSGEARAETIVHQQHLDPYPVHIVVPVKVGDETVNFILDTAADICACDPSLQKWLGPKQEAGTIKGVAKSVSTATFEAPAMSIGTHQAGRQRAFVTDMAPVSAAAGAEVKGVLGAPALKDLAVWLDFDHGSLKLIEHFDSPPAGMQALDLEFEPGSHAPKVNLFFMNRGVRFDLDLGYTGAFLLKPESFKRFVTMGALNLDTDTPHKGLSITGEDRQERMGRWESWELWGQDVRYSTATEAQGDVIGLEFLVNFNLIIDLDHAKLYYQRRQAPPPINPFSMLGGVIFVKDGCGVVNEVHEGKRPLWEAGLRKGDKILRLGSLEKGGFNQKSLYELALNHAGETVEVQYLHQGIAGPVTGQLTIGALKSVFAAPELK